METASLSDLEVAAVDRVVSCLGRRDPVPEMVLVLGLSIFLPCPALSCLGGNHGLSNTPRKNMSRSWLLIPISIPDLPVITIARQPWHQPPQLDHQPFLSPAYPCPDLVVIPCPVQKALQNPGSCMRLSKTLTNPPGFRSQSLHNAQHKDSLCTDKASHMTKQMYFGKSCEATFIPSLSIALTPHRKKLVKQYGDPYLVEKSRVMGFGTTTRWPH